MSALLWTARRRGAARVCLGRLSSHLVEERDVPEIHAGA
jgi:hypothetical protein